MSTALANLPRVRNFEICALTVLPWEGSSGAPSSLIEPVDIVRAAFRTAANILSDAHEKGAVDG